MLLSLLLMVTGGRSTPPVLVVHYMPWFQAKPRRPQWGWHWTMNAENPDSSVRGAPQIASHYHPAIGPYDSDDEDVIDYQVQLMKLAGIDGALIDWYGNIDCDDYLAIHTATAHFISVARRAGLRFGIVYEDRTVPNLIKHGLTTPASALKAGNTLLRWVDYHWFSQPDYLRLNGKPVFLVFGPEYYKGDVWNGVFAGLAHQPSFFTLDSVQAPGAGVFGWPQPQGGDWASKLNSYYTRARSAPLQIAPAFPRFNDFYKDAGVGPSNGRIPDNSGKTYVQTLNLALRSNAPIIQLVTWNDYGEGTVIEPTTEFGTRDLAATQNFRRDHIQPSFRFKPADLALPGRLLKLRRAGGDRKKLDVVSELLLQGKTAKARALLHGLK
ncbi:MAG: glycoside hydrolase family 71/99-like protein [Fimbriimonadaceae bacterium]